MRLARALPASLVVLAVSTSPASAQETDPAGHDQGSHVVTPDGMVSMPAEHLQVMIDETPPGGTLLVPEAVYVGAVTIDEPVTLEAEGRPVIDGNLEGSVVTITAPDVTIRGLTLRRSAIGPLDSPSGLMLEQADHATIQDVTIEECYIGITVRLSDAVTIDGVSIRGQGVITGEEHVVETDDEGEHRQHAGGDQGVGMHTDAQVRGDGIWLWNATDAVVRDTTIDEARDGVYVSYGTGNLLERIRITDSRYAVHDMYAEDLTVRASVLEGNLSGLVLMYGGPVRVVGNTIIESGSPSTGFGVLVKDVGTVTIERNVVADNRVGVQVDDAGRTGGEPTLLRGNTIAMNHIGLLLMPSADSVVVGNGFVENSTQVTMGGQGGTQAVWSLDGLGNYWSDYGGFDTEGDGTGDLAYVESGRMSELLASEPLLLALASGPAFRLLASVEGKWSPAEPLVQDDAPLVTAPGPSLRGDDRGAPMPLWLPGLALTLGCGWLLLRARRPRGMVAVR
ncbi:MAG: right-handed parallel beta-helix repeat-containing protein [Actinomycetota bacterium]